NCCACARGPPWRPRTGWRQQSSAPLPARRTGGRWRAPRANERRSTTAQPRGGSGASFLQRRAVTRVARERRAPTIAYGPHSVNRARAFRVWSVYAGRTRLGRTPMDFGLFFLMQRDQAWSEQAVYDSALEQMLAAEGRG